MHHRKLLLSSFVLVRPHHPLDSEQTRVRGKIYPRYAARWAWLAAVTDLQTCPDPPALHQDSLTPAHSIAYLRSLAPPHSPPSRPIVHPPTRTRRRPPPSCTMAASFEPCRVSVALPLARSQICIRWFPQQQPVSSVARGGARGGVRGGQRHPTPSGRPHAGRRTFERQ